MVHHQVPHQGRIQLGQHDSHPTRINCSRLIFIHSSGTGINTSLYLGKRELQKIIPGSDPLNLIFVDQVTRTDLVITITRDHLSTEKGVMTAIVKHHLTTAAEDVLAGTKTEIRAQRGVVTTTTPLLKNMIPFFDGERVPRNLLAVQGMINNQITLMIVTIRGGDVWKILIRDIPVRRRF